MAITYTLTKTDARGYDGVSMESHVKLTEAEATALLELVKTAPDTESTMRQVLARKLGHIVAHQ